MFLQLLSKKVRKEKNTVKKNGGDAAKEVLECLLICLSARNSVSLLKLINTLSYEIC